MTSGGTITCHSCISFYHNSREFLEKDEFYDRIPSDVAMEMQSISSCLGYGHMVGKKSIRPTCTKLER